MDKLTIGYAVLRKHLSILMLVVGALLVATVPTSYVWYAIGGWAGAAAAVMLVAHVKTRAVSNRFGGLLLEFVPQPTPMDSVFELLSKYGAPPNSINSITLMSSDLQQSIDYLFSNDSHRSFLSVMRHHPNIKVVMYGTTRETVVKIPDPKIQIEFKQTSQKRTEHTNLITTNDDKAFVWYEPYHLVIGKHHYFTRGGYLIQIDNNTRQELEREFYPSLMQTSDKTNQRLSPASVN